MTLILVRKFYIKLEVLFCINVYVQVNDDKHIIIDVKMKIHIEEEKYTMKKKKISKKKKIIKKKYLI